MRAIAVGVAAPEVNRDEEVGPALPKIRRTTGDRLRHKVVQKNARASYPSADLT